MPRFQDHLKDEPGGSAPGNSNGALAPRPPEQRSTMSAPPLSGTLLPAVPQPLAGIAPAQEFSQRLQQALEDATTAAYAAGAGSQADRLSVAAGVIDADVRDQASRASRALEVEDYPAAALHSAQAAAGQQAASTIRRALHGEIR